MMLLAGLIQFFWADKDWVTEFEEEIGFNVMEKWGICEIFKGGQL